MSENAKQILYLEDGREFDEDEYITIQNEYKNKMLKPPLVVAKHLVGEIDTYYGLFASSQLFDPTNKEYKYRVNNIWKMRKVDKETFDIYIRFLKTSNKLLLKQAERKV